MNKDLQYYSLIAEELVEKYNDDGLFSFKRWAATNNADLVKFNSKQFRAVLKVEIIEGERKLTVGYSSDIKTLGTRRFALAHEVAHYILDEKIIKKDLAGNSKLFVAYDTFYTHSTPGDKKAEQKYNDLAAEILMPRALFLEATHVMNDIQLANVFGVSVAAAQARKNNLSHGNK